MRATLTRATDLPGASRPALAGTDRMRVGIVVGAVLLLVLPLPTAAWAGGSAGPHGVPTPPVRSATAPALSTGVSPLPSSGALSGRGLANVQLPGPRPIGLRSSASLPGWEAISPTSFPGLSSRLATLGACPGGASSCPGHDEPGISFYSTVAGSGGNVSWIVSLPVERNATLNQSNLYSAAWLGLTLSDPHGWLGACFVEVQLYPDQSFYNPSPAHPARSAPGSWVGAVVGWQIDAATGAEDACFYEPLYLNGVPGPAFLNMTQGDRLNLTTVGWAGNPKGESVSVKDVTNGQSSSVTLFNTTGGYALDPVYSTNAYEDSLEWRTGGEYPIFFGFDVGRSVNGAWASNGTSGGCSPGTGATVADPAAPCASYDPGAWANDTVAPWHIGTPQFYNAAGKVKPSQVAFSQTTGGITSVGAASGGGCAGRAGSANCSVPWFSYSCSAGAFEFGATDYPGLTNDFGKYNEYNPAIEENALGAPFYAPRNFSVPFCSSPSYTITVHQRGIPTAAIYFLSQAISGESNISGVVTGTYSANAINGPGSRFEFWDPVGNISVANKGDPFTSVTVSGNGVLVAFFNNNPPNATKVTFNDLPGGWIGVTPALTFSGSTTGTGNALGTLASGAKLTLLPGLYTIQAVPSRGFAFSTWSVNNTGATLAAPTLPVTWLSITSLQRSVTVVAHYTATTTKAAVKLVVVGNGTARIATFSVTSSGGGSNSGTTVLPLGGYSLVGSPGNGSNSVTWFPGPGAVLSNYSASTNVSVEGPATIEAVFGEVAAVTLTETPTAGGTVSFLTPSSVGPTITNGTVALLRPGSYPIEANLHTGFSFTTWTTAGSVHVLNASQLVTALVVTGTGSATANFVKAAHTFTVKLGSIPTLGGSLVWDAGTAYTNLTANKLVTAGEHTATAVALPGWTFAGWNVSGKVATVGAGPGVGELLNVSGGGQLQAEFRAVVSPVTFVLVTSASALPTTAALTINGTKLSTGETTRLATGSYAAVLSGNASAVQVWTATSNLTVSVGANGSGTIVVKGSGTIYVVLLPGHGSGAGVAARAAAPVGGPPPPDLGKARSGPLCLRRGSA